MCTSFDTGYYEIYNKELMVNLTYGFFICRESPGASFRYPYCVCSAPFQVKINEYITSYLRYLPTKEGEWVDVKERAAKVYTQTLLFVSDCVQVYDSAVSTKENLSQVRVMIGTPRLEGDSLVENNALKIKNRYCDMKEDYTLYNYRIYYDDAYTYVFNDFCYLNTPSCSPTDFVIAGYSGGPRERVSRRKRGAPAGGPGEFLVRQEEVIHK